MLSLEEEVCSLRASPLLIDTSINNSCSPHKELFLIHGDTDATLLVGYNKDDNPQRIAQRYCPLTAGETFIKNIKSYFKDGVELPDDEGHHVISRMPVAFSLSHPDATPESSKKSHEAAKSAFSPNGCQSALTPKIGRKRFGSDYPKLKVDTTQLKREFAAKSTPVAGGPRRRLSPTSASSFQSPLLQPPPPSSNPLLTTDLSAINFASNSNSTLAYSAASSVYELFQTPALPAQKRSSSETSAVAITALFSGTSDLDILRCDASSEQPSTNKPNQQIFATPDDTKPTETSSTFNSSTETLHDFSRASYPPNALNWLHSMNACLLPPLNATLPHINSTHLDNSLSPSSWPGNGLQSATGKSLADLFVQHKPRRRKNH